MFIAPFVMLSHANPNEFSRTLFPLGPVKITQYQITVDLGILHALFAKMRRVSKGRSRFKDGRRRGFFTVYHLRDMYVDQSGKLT
jgi:prolipoprotein diacylglyceryltransferase